jgi:hypothetical protein
VVPPTSTCCLPRPPQLRSQLKEVPALVSLEAHGKSTDVIFGVNKSAVEMEDAETFISRAFAKRNVASPSYYISEL